MMIYMLISLSLIFLIGLVAAGMEINYRRFLKKAQMKDGKH